MEDDTAAPESLLPYDDWTEEALRQVVVRALNYRRRATACPGEHHFYITFRTDHPGVVDPAAAARAIPAGDDHRPAAPVLGPQVDDEAERQFSVGLSFGGIPPP